MILGICGLAGSGKDTVSKYIEDMYGFKTLSLADPIKDFASLVFNFSYDQLWGPSELRSQEIVVDVKSAKANFDQHSKRWLAFFDTELKHMPGLEAWFNEVLLYRNTSARYVLQTLGTEFGRNQLGPNVWIDHLISKAEFYQATNECKGIVTSDVRFVNEFEAIKAKGGRIIKVVRPGVFPTGIKNHISETEQESIPSDGFDLMLYNNTTLDNLYSSLDLYMEVLHAA